MSKEEYTEEMVKLLDSLIGKAISVEFTSEGYNCLVHGELQKITKGDDDYIIEDDGGGFTSMSFKASLIRRFETEESMRKFII